LGRLPLSAILLLSLLGYGLIAWWFPLLPNINQSPPGDIRSFAPSLTRGIAYAALLLGLYALLIPAFRRIERDEKGTRSLLIILTGSLLLALPLLFTYPINSTDIFRYVIRGRIASVYGQSPFIVAPSSFPGDPFTPLVGEWANETSPYGPLWELVASGLTFVSGDSLAAGVMLFKLLALVCFLMITALIWTSLPADRPRSGYSLLWAWNPALLLIFIVDGHNDALMILWLVLGYFVALNGRTATGFLIMILAALTKPIAILALPFFFLYLYHHEPVDRRRLLLAALIGIPVLVWLSFLPLSGSGGALQTALYLVTRLSREATGGASFSPAVWLYMAFNRQVPIEPIGQIAQALFIAAALGLAWLAFRKRSVLRGIADIFFSYIVTALNFRIWYAAWPFPWLLLDNNHQCATAAKRSAYRLRAGFWFLLTSQLSVILYGHIRIHLFNGDHSITHLIGVPFVFGLPLIMARLPFRISGDKTRV